MAKIFDRNKMPVMRPKRNVFDKSFASHSSFPLCKLVPVYCEEVLPDDSVSIDPSFALRFTPTVFPIQSKVHCSLHFFYCRNRNVWKDWPSHIGATENEGLVVPYLDVSPSRREMFKTGSLMDYLGVPSTLAGKSSQLASLATGSSQLHPGQSQGVPAVSLDQMATNNVPIQAINRVNNFSLCTSFRAPSDDRMLQTLQSNETPTINFLTTTHRSHDDHYVNGVAVPSLVPLHYPLQSTGTVRLTGAQNSLDDGMTIPLYFILVGGDKNFDNCTIKAFVEVEMTYDLSTNTFSASQASLAEAFNDYLSKNSGFVILYYPGTANSTKPAVSSAGTLTTDESYKTLCNLITFAVETSVIRDATDADTYPLNPFIKQLGETKAKIPIPAFTARMYESIYNYFYRNEIVDPFKPDGINPNYNDYIRSHDGGADTNDYYLYDRNWEKDCFTSATPTPQQGDAPLVGISISPSGLVSFTDSSDPDNPREYHGQVTTQNDGDTIASVDWFDSDTPKDMMHKFSSQILQGISISEFRQVNALQRWLETNIRRGLKYTDQMLSHFGVKPKYNECDVPEFLGGIHRVVDVNTITNTAASPDAPLGEYAGQLYCAATSKHPIRKFCDEHGFIIGIMSVYPEPIYSQSLPKHYLKSLNAFDYFWPEMGHLSFQPICNAEILPIGTNAEDIANSTDKLHGVFGYQRAWYDYVASNDQLHGLMRTEFNDFVINRIFDQTPQLGHDFIAASESDVNNIFAVESGHHCLGQFRFNCSFKRPIPRFGIPKLE